MILCIPSESEIHPTFVHVAESDFSQESGELF